MEYSLQIIQTIIAGAALFYAINRAYYIMSTTPTMREIHKIKKQTIALHKEKVEADLLLVAETKLKEMMEIK